MLDPANHTLIPLSDLPDELPRRRGRKTHTSMPYRWSTTGCRGVVLETTQVGGTRCTTPAAFCRFFAALAAADPTPQPQRTPRQRAREIAAAERELTEAGA